MIQQVRSKKKLLNFLQYCITLLLYTDQGDYFLGSGILIYAVNDTQQDVIVFVINDLASEQTESFFVDILSANGTLCDTATVFILDDDQVPTIQRMLMVYTSNA